MQAAAGFLPGIREKAADIQNVLFDIVTDSPETAQLGERLPGMIFHHAFQTQPKKHQVLLGLSYRFRQAEKTFCHVNHLTNNFTTK